jgi:hypothetical protein
VQTEWLVESVLALQQVDAILAGLCALPHPGDNALPALEAYQSRADELANQFEVQKSQLQERINVAIKASDHTTLLDLVAQIKALDQELEQAVKVEQEVL